jgi:hypothetical protein
MNSLPMRAMGGSALCLLALGWGGCGYSDFRLPELAPAEPQVGYEWETSRRPGFAAWRPRRVGLARCLEPLRGPPRRRLLQFLFGFRRDHLAYDPGDFRQRAVLEERRRSAGSRAASGEGGYIAANGSALFDEGEFWYWYQAGPKETPRLGLARSERRPALAQGALSGDGLRSARKLGRTRAGRSLRPSKWAGISTCFTWARIARGGNGWEWPGPWTASIGRRCRSNPILELGKYGSFDEMGLGEPAVWIAHGYYWMLYTGRDAQQNRRLGMARSTDGVHWEKLPAAFRGARRGIAG